MKLFCSKCGGGCIVQIGIDGEKLEPAGDAPQLVTVECGTRSCFGRWFVIRESTESLAATLRHIRDAATTGPLKPNVTVIP
jgi:hypothetical protein